MRRRRLGDGGGQRSWDRLASADTSRASFRNLCVLCAARSITVYTRFGANAEAGIGNIPGGFYRVFADWDYSSNPAGPEACGFVNNFTDANNWTFSINRSNDDAEAMCKGC